MDQAALYPTGALALQNINANGDVPKERIPKASDARTICETLVQANRSRNLLNSKVKGMIDGNKPYSANRLKNAGQSNRTNVNWLEGSAKVSSALVPYYDLFAASTYYVDVKTDWGPPALIPDWNRILCEEVDRTLKDWDGFDWNMQTMLNDFVTYGKGFITFDRKTDWRFTATPQSRFLFPDGTQGYPEKWELVQMRQSMQINELYNYIRDPEAAKKAGWNVEATKDAIFHAYPKTNTQANTLYDYDFVQQQIKDHDIMQGIRLPTIQVVHTFVREFTGKISHLIVVEYGYKRSDGGQASNTSMDETNTGNDFLYKRIGFYDNFLEIMCPFVFEVLDGSINGVQGLGHKLFSPMETKNRLLCSSTDLAFLRSGITLQAQTANAYQKLNLVQIGGFNVIPPDFAVQQSTIMGDLGAPLDMNRQLDMIIDNNTGVYRNEGQKVEGNPRTYGEVKLQYMNSTVLSNSAVNRFYGQLDKLYKVVVSRIFAKGNSLNSKNDGQRMAAECQARCIARGVHPEALNHISQIRAYRVSGNGSMFMRQQATMSLAQLVPSFPEEGKQRWLEDAVAVNSNQYMVNRYIPKGEEANNPSDQMNEAMLENAAMKIGAPVTWTPTQNNVIHCQVHLEAAEAAATTLAQGANPQDVLTFFQGVGANVAQHLQHLANDPLRQNEFKVFQAKWTELAKTTDQLQEMVQKQMEDMQAQQAAQKKAQAIQDGMDPETKILEAKTKNQMAIQAAKAQQAIAIKQSKHEVDLAKAQQDMALSDARTAAEIQRQKLLAQQQNANSFTVP